MLITRCPDCATAFRCHPEQLELARGWVRCGRCDTVFEALKHAWPRPFTSPTEPLAAVHGGTVVEPSMDGWTDLATTLNMEQEPAVDARPAIGVSHGVRWMLRTVVVVLTLLLPVQWLIAQRDVLAAQSLLWRNVWSDGCRWLGCDLDWPRQPQSLRIESIHFEPSTSGPSGVQLQIRNMSVHPVAAPWVELSLLGLRDEVLVRRALSPSEWGLDTPVLALREAIAQLRFELSDDVASAVTGYKAILFYP